MLSSETITRQWRSYGHFWVTNYGGMLFIYATTANYPDYVIATRDAIRMYSNLINNNQTGSMGGAYHFGDVCGINSTFTQGVVWEYFDIATTYTRDAIFMNNDTIDRRQWLPYGIGITGYGDYGGLLFLAGSNWLGGIGFYTATYKKQNMWWII